MEVSVVVNINVPSSYKDYVHRVGRTARAGNLHAHCLRFKIWLLSCNVLLVVLQGKEAWLSPW